QEPRERAKRDPEERIPERGEWTRERALERVDLSVVDRLAVRAPLFQPRRRAEHDSREDRMRGEVGQMPGQRPGEIFLRGIEATERREDREAEPHTLHPLRREERLDLKRSRGHDRQVVPSNASVGHGVPRRKTTLSTSAVVAPSATHRKTCFLPATCAWYAAARPAPIMEAKTKPIRRAVKAPPSRGRIASSAARPISVAAQAQSAPTTKTRRIPP